MRRREVTAYLLLAPSLFFLALFTYWPLVQVAVASLTERAFGGAAHFGIGNYARLFADPHFARAAWNNVVYAAGTIVPSLALALLFAIGLAAGTRLNAALRALLVMPMFMPLVAASALFLFIFLPGGDAQPVQAGAARLRAALPCGRRRDRLACRRVRRLAGALPVRHRSRLSGEAGVAALRLARDRRAPHQAPIARVIEQGRRVQGAAVIPDD